MRVFYRVIEARISIGSNLPPNTGWRIHYEHFHGRHIIVSTPLGYVRVGMDIQ